MSDFVERMRAEAIELAERMGRLGAFLDTPIFKGLPDIERLLLEEQLSAMLTYHRLLTKRLSLHAGG